MLIRWRTVITRLAGRTVSPSRTVRLPKAGRYALTGSSRLNAPLSISCIAAQVVNTFVQEYSQYSSSPLTGSAPAASRCPAMCR